jgi:hypothetical protein
MYDDERDVLWVNPTGVALSVGMAVEHYDGTKHTIVELGDGTVTLKPRREAPYPISLDLFNRQFLVRVELP